MLRKLYMSVLISILIVGIAIVMGVLINAPTHRDTLELSLRPGERIEFTCPAAARIRCRVSIAGELFPEPTIWEKERSWLP